MTIGLLFAGFSMNNPTYGQQLVDNTNRTVSLNSAPENEAIVAIPAPTAEDFSPETEQKAGTKEKVLENSDESSINGARGNVEQAEIQKDKVSDGSDQTSEDRQAQVPEDEEKVDNSDAREEVNDNDDYEGGEGDDGDDHDVPFELPFP